MISNNANDVLNRARRDEEKIVILATIATGVNKDRHVCCLTPRDELMSGIETIAALPRHERRGVLASVSKAVHTATNQRLENYNSSNDADLMSDLALLMALQWTSGESVLQGSNLSNLVILIDDDDTLPWDRRGMLSPSAGAKFGYGHLMAETRGSM
jgi:hypothetical protein